MAEIKNNKDHAIGTPSRTRICFFSSVASFDTGMPICTHALILHYAKDPRFEVHAVFPEGGEFVDRLAAAGVPVSIVPFARARSARRGAAFLRFCHRASGRAVAFVPVHEGEAIRACPFFRHHRRSVLSVRGAFGRAGGCPCEAGRRDLCGTGRTAVVERCCLPTRWCAFRRQCCAKAGCPAGAPR